MRLPSLSHDNGASLPAAVLDTVDDAVLVLDAHARVLTANRAARRLLGIVAGAEAIAGTSPLTTPNGRWIAREGGDELDPASLPWSKALSEGRPARGQIIALCHDDDGGLTWTSVNAHPYGLVDPAHPSLSEPNALSDPRADAPDPTSTDPDPPRVLGVVVSLRDITRDRLENDADVSLVDGLTGLPNRRVLVDRLQHGLARVRRRGGHVGVLFVDLDRFAFVNDSLGHEAGDELLRRAAQRLVSVLRPNDTATRLGSDEFVVVCEDIDDAEAAGAVAERIERALESPYELAGERVTVTASVGVVLGDSSTTPGELLRNADRAMEQAKRNGGGQHRYSDAAATQAVDRLELERGLRRALDEQQMRLWYQPVIDLRTGRMRGVEALLRWAHPERGIVAPGEFIQMAEESGAIIPIGGWALVEACRTIAGGAAGAEAWVAVNVSGRQAGRPDFAATVQYALDASGLSADRLCLELTETVFLEASTVTATALEQLKALGVRLAIDDFGTGYSSLTYLRRFPVDTVKIDRSFVAGLRVAREDDAIVEAVIDLGATFELNVVAEGVETSIQADSLREMGCHYAQGFHLGHPVPPDEILVR